MFLLTKHIKSINIINLRQFYNGYCDEFNDFRTNFNVIQNDISDKIQIRLSKIKMIQYAKYLISK